MNAFRCRCPECQRQRDPAGLLPSLLQASLQAEPLVVIPGDDEPPRDMGLLEFRRIENDLAELEFLRKEREEIKKAMAERDWLEQALAEAKSKMALAGADGSPRSVDDALQALRDLEAAMGGPTDATERLADRLKRAGDEIRGPGARVQRAESEAPLVPPLRRERIFE